MARVDLHVHSRHSEHPSDWFLQRLGAKGSYSDPEEIHRAAKLNGMDFVTITDRNRLDGALALAERHPEDSFTGCEVTTYFPEDGCKVQILVYGLSSEDFEKIQRIRSNIYDLREFLAARDLVHAAANPIAPTQTRLTLEHIEKLFLLFNHFEVQNGGRSRACNESMRLALHSLTQERIEEMARRHRIDPIGPEPWRKGLVGGSDDHAGLYVGGAYTEAEGRTTEEFLFALAERRTQAAGRSNDYHSLAFSVYKIAYDFSKAKSGPLSRSILSEIAEMAFDRNSLSIVDKIRIHTIQNRSGKSQDRWQELLQDALASLRGEDAAAPDHRLSLAYDRIANLSDELLRMILRSIQSDLRKGEVTRFVTTLTASLPGVFLSVPFLTALRHLHRSRNLIDAVEGRFAPGQGSRRAKRILWFTDVLTEMNGVCKTLQNISRVAHCRGDDIRIVTCLPEDARIGDFPPNVIDLPFIYDFSLPLYERYRLRVPSILKSLELLAAFDPDEVYMSTPGPVGLLGLLLARLISARAVAVYHTDYTLQSSFLGRDEHLSQAIESYTRWFHCAADRIAVPTLEYMDLLEARGFDRGRMVLFHRGIDTRTFEPRRAAHAEIRQIYCLREGVTLLYAGRISEDKSLEFLLEIYAALRNRRPDINLVIAGTGPLEDDLKRRFSGDARVVFTGNLSHTEIASLYAGCDLFVFPSTTDTFGMVVLEAQACGLPAVVSNLGGPKEIVLDGVTGLQARANDLDDWIEKIEALIDRKEHRPVEWEAMVEAARQRVVERHDWDTVLARLTARTNARVRPRPSGFNSGAYYEAAERGSRS